MVRNLSPMGLRYLTIREGGAHFKVYDDGYGFLTVGVGHLVMDSDNLKLNDTIPKGLAYIFLQEDLEWAREAVERYIEFHLEQHEFDALVIFCFNIGQNAFKRSSLVRRLNAHEDKEAVVAFEMPRWNQVGGDFVRGLKNRRVDTAQMFIRCDYNVDWQGLKGQV